MSEFSSSDSGFERFFVAGFAVFVILRVDWANFLGAALGFEAAAAFLGAAFGFYRF